MRLAMILAGLYGVVAAAYIVFSSRIAAALSPSIDSLGRLEVYKGLAFVAITTLMAFLFSWFFLRRIRQQQELIAQQMEVVARADRTMLAGMFAAAMAHDVRNALMVAMAASEQIGTLSPDDPWREELSTNLRESLQAIARWMERLLRFSSEKFSESEQTFDLVAQVRSAMELCKKHSRLFERRIDLVVPDDPVELQGIPDLVDRALFNLVLNAADATQQGGQIRITVQPASVESSRGEVVVRVEDDGPGVPPPDREAILQPFFSTKADGGGLGLVSFVACAEQHQGSISVGESSLGGASFELRLPAKRTAA